MHSSPLFEKYWRILQKICKKFLLTLFIEKIIVQFKRPPLLLSKRGDLISLVLFDFAPSDVVIYHRAAGRCLAVAALGSMYVFLYGHNSFDARRAILGPILRLPHLLVPVIFPFRTLTLKFFLHASHLIHLSPAAVVSSSIGLLLPQYGHATAASTGCAAAIQHVTDRMRQLTPTQAAHIADMAEQAVQLLDDNS